MTDTPQASALQDAMVFSALDARQLAVVARHMPRYTLEAGSTLFHQGQTGQSMFVVLEGRLDVRVHVRAGEVEICPLWAGDVVGEMACLDPEPRSAMVVAHEKTVVAELDRATLSALWRQAPVVGAKLVKGIAKTVSSRLRETDRRIELTLAHLSGHPRVSEREAELLGDRRAPSRKMKRRPRPSKHRGALDLEALAEASGLSHDAIEGLTEITEVVTWKSGATLFEEGDRGTDCVLVARGEVEVVKAVEQSSRVVAVLGPGTMVGQLALVDNDVRSASVRAAGKVVGLRLDRSEFSELLSDGDPLGLRLLTLAAVATVRQLRLATRRLAQLRATREAVRAADEKEMEKRQRETKSGDEPAPERKPAEAENAWERALRGSGVSLDMLDQLEVKTHEGQLSSAQLNAKGRFS